MKNVNFTSSDFEALLVLEDLSEMGFDFKIKSLAIDTTSGEPVTKWFLSDMYKVDPDGLARPGDSLKEDFDYGLKFHLDFYYKEGRHVLLEADDKIVDDTLLKTLYDSYYGHFGYKNLRKHLGQISRYFCLTDAITCIDRDSSGVFHVYVNEHANYIQYSDDDLDMIARALYQSSSYINGIDGLDKYIKIHKIGESKVRALDINLGPMTIKPRLGDRPYKYWCFEPDAC